ncbi:MAG: hypothetical protein PHF65_08065 [Oscillospiraceae bacterium]|nr:hypothetical protein [Oscillospiraceae bacterium]
MSEYTFVSAFSVQPSFLASIAPWYVVDVSFCSIQASGAVVGVGVGADVGAFVGAWVGIFVGAIVTVASGVGVGVLVGVGVGVLV